MNDKKQLSPLVVASVVVIGIAQWPYEFTSLSDAAPCVHTLDEEIKKMGTKLDFIEVRIEFTTGESERCAFKEKERVFSWLDRFEDVG